MNNLIDSIGATLIIWFGVLISILIFISLLLSPAPFEEKE